MFQVLVYCCWGAIGIDCIFSLLNKIYFKREQFGVISIVLGLLVYFFCFIVYQSTLFLWLCVIITCSRLALLFNMMTKTILEELEYQYNDKRLFKPAKKLVKLYELKLQLVVAQKYVQEVIDKLENVLDRCDKKQICYEHVEILFTVHLKNYMEMCESYLELNEKEMFEAKNRITTLTEQYKEVIEQTLNEAIYKSKNSISSEVQEFNSCAEIFNAGLENLNSITPEQQLLPETNKQNE